MFVIVLKAFFLVLRVLIAILKMLKCLATENNPYEFNQLNKHKGSNNMLHSLGHTMVHLNSAYVRSAH